ncbi:hypothetical protein GLAREA_10839 [Glarea lozoyensis ATCC 20868]|uniref:Uncharacterized protein n=1 Tax=Glarea lozoyensis (strain ATCC 20868 / MF5171) TaxID=1116229 RepID=S3E9Y4_GLAL2|nr:uncharacterized protein GLAREA_10839 [Glarea lozoyensis ATCC 20868]EPE35143.1 hypothetical protein GLAREA_10839 [Glarea lozoyensis ATCC 20868]
MTLIVLLTGRGWVGVVAEVGLKMQMQKYGEQEDDIDLAWIEKEAWTRTNEQELQKQIGRAGARTPLYPFDGVSAKNQTRSNLPKCTQKRKSGKVEQMQ